MFRFSGGLLMCCVCQVRGEWRRVKINSRSRGIRYTKNQHPVLGSRYRSSCAQVFTSPTPGRYYQVYPEHKFVISALLLSSPKIHHRVLLKCGGWVHIGLTSFPVRPKGKGVLAPQLLCPRPSSKSLKTVCSSAPWQAYNACRRKGFGSTAQCAERVPSGNSVVPWAPSGGSG